jgi:hypothetical protein
VCSPSQRTGSWNCAGKKPAGRKGYSSQLSAAPGETRKRANFLKTDTILRTSRITVRYPSFGLKSVIVGHYLFALSSSFAEIGQKWLSLLFSSSMEFQIRQPRTSHPNSRLSERLIVSDISCIISDLICMISNKLHVTAPTQLTVLGLPSISLTHDSTSQPRRIDALLRYQFTCLAFPAVYSYELKLSNTARWCNEAEAWKRRRRPSSPLRCLNPHRGWAIGA